MSESNIDGKKPPRAFSYPIPLGICVVFVLWMAQFAPFWGIFEQEEGSIIFRLTLGLGLIMAFFLTLGVTRYQERQEGQARFGKAWLGLAILLPILIAVGVEPFLHLLAADFGSDASNNLVNGIRWQVYLHLFAISVCAAFVLPYADGRSSDDWFVYWTLTSLQAAGIGLLLAGLAWIVLSLLGMLLSAALVGPFFSTYFWSLLLPFGLLWPVSVLGGLPSIRDRDGTPPPLGRWMRILSRQIAMPAWLAMMGLGYLLLVQRLATPGPDGFWIMVIVGVLIVGKITSITYLIALRDRQESRLAELWRRWQFAALLPGLATAIYGLTHGGAWHELGMWRVFVVASLVWLLISTLYATVRSQPRALFFAWAYILCIAVGTVAAAPVALVLGHDDPFASSTQSKPKPRIVQTTWPAGGKAEQWPGGIWTLDTWGRSNVTTGDGDMVKGSGGGDAFTVQSAVVEAGSAMQFRINDCVIATISTAELLSIRTSAVRPVLVAENHLLHLTIQFMRITFVGEEGSEKIKYAGHIPWLLAFKGMDIPLNGTCPDPVPLRVLTDEERRSALG